MKTLKELVSGLKLAYGDHVRQLNISEKLNAAKRILKDDIEREASVATNLKRKVNRLSNELITRWQNENYEITKRGRTARLNYIAVFLRKHASITNDPAFGMQTLKRDN